MAELTPGMTVGKYVLEEFLEQGSMGEVWQGRHTRLSKRQVAIKMLLPGHSLLGDSVKRFLREAEILADLGDQDSHVVNRTMASGVDFEDSTDAIEIS